MCKAPPRPLRIKPGVGQNMASRAAPAATNPVCLMSALLVRLLRFAPDPVPTVFGDVGRVRPSACLVVR